VAITLTPRLGLYQWGQGSDPTGRTQWNSFLSAIDASVATDDGAIGGTSLPVTGHNGQPLANARYAQTVDGTHRRMYRRAGGAWQQIGGNTWSEPVYQRGTAGSPLSGRAREIGHADLPNPTVLENYDGNAIRGGRLALLEQNVGGAAALHSGDSSPVDLVNLGRVYARTRNANERGVVASAHAATAGNLFTAREAGGTDPWLVDSQGRMRAQAPTAFGGATLGATAIAAAPGTLDSAADLYAGASKPALRLFRGAGDSIGSVAQDAITLGKASWTGARIDLIAPTVKATGAFEVTGSATVASLIVPGNATVAGTLGVTGATTLGALTAGASTVGALTASSAQINGNAALTGLLDLPTTQPAGTSGGQVRIASDWALEVYDGTKWRGRFGGAAGRRHAWHMPAGTVPNNSSTKITSWSSVLSGSIATLSSGNLVLNRAGLWSLRFTFFADSGNDGFTRATLKTVDGTGLFSGLHYIQDARTRRITLGVDGSGNSECCLTWTGYVDATYAAKQIAAYVYQNNHQGSSLTNCVMTLAAEFLSD
jgi:hypothetical protein